MAEECAREGEHGYKRKALPPCCCDITPQTFPSSFSLDLLTLLFLRISMEPRTLKQNIREIVDRKEVFAFEPRWGKKNSFCLQKLVMTQGFVGSTSSGEP